MLPLCLHKEKDGGIPKQYQYHSTHLSLTCIKYEMRQYAAQLATKFLCAVRNPSELGGPNSYKTKM